jgi:DNA-binding NtrC family response regulator
LIDKKAFRLDLYYRLNVLNIHLPPLRELGDDIERLFLHFLQQFSIGERPKIQRVSDDAIRAMRQYQWPGNIRELRNVAERALIVSRNQSIELEDLPIDRAGACRPAVPLPRSMPSLREQVEEAERQAISQALAQTGNNRVEAARILSIHRTGLYQKMKKYHIS